MFPGFGTLVNVITVIVGSSIGLLLGHRLPQRTRDTVTDALGLVTLLIGALSAIEVTSAALSDAVGSSAPVLIVLGSLLIGGIAGSLIDIERRLEGFGVWLQFRFKAKGSQARFVEAFVSSSLVFCVGPLTILGSLSDGLGLGTDQLLLKATLDGFASIAFAASLGVGVMASALAVGVIQGSLTLVGVLVGDFLPDPHLAAITATGGLLLVGVGIRLLQLKAIPVGNLLPALVVAPLLVQLVVVLR
ncbi:hypothetical protein MLP_28640 [Microlunatus phosphovorus NM-1]|uniref:DUF554 domain-containing protein n=1 Tax=Microlunatus phosphovorus (strain ATCC 700054 / DSM 10555 / JCM 9379 / NBRC 101784 / NCIMB 13414 / VKM Ac-1990 / NM-1) TaxID=1032480 RepID=F5XJH8_MICPN|nr:DUF554 domain-containing protein [Microlunatus phosphovorus]BAK35878.1 hypothetical protein MLP_28640 [Microlunatus phosphovorus NM-1]